MTSSATPFVSYHIHYFADGVIAPTFTRQQRGRIGVGADISEIRYSKAKTYKLPPSTLGGAMVEAT